jgi:hypothetical protein
MGFLSNLRDKIRASRAEDDASFMAGAEDEGLSGQPHNGPTGTAEKVQATKDDVSMDGETRIRR